MRNKLLLVAGKLIVKCLTFELKKKYTKKSKKKKQPLKEPKVWRVQKVYSAKNVSWARIVQKKKKKKRKEWKKLNNNDFECDN